MNKINKENIITIILLVIFVGVIGFYSGRLYERNKSHNIREKFTQKEHNINTNREQNIQRKNINR